MPDMIMRISAQTDYLSIIVQDRIVFSCDRNLIRTEESCEAFKRVCDNIMARCLAAADMGIYGYMQWNDPRGCNFVEERLTEKPSGNLEKIIRTSLEAAIETFKQYGSINYEEQIEKIKVFLKEPA